MAPTPVIPQAPRPIVLQPHEGEHLQVVDDAVRILADSAATGGGSVFLVTETAPGKGPPLHRHTHDDEYFYVIEGLVKFSLAGKELTLGPGGFVAVPRGTIHSFRNMGPTPSRMLVVCTPGGLELPFRETHALMRTSTKSLGEQMGALATFFGRVGVEFVGPPLSA